MQPTGWQRSLQACPDQSRFAVTGQAGSHPSRFRGAAASDQVWAWRGSEGASACWTVLAGCQEQKRFVLGKLKEGDHWPGPGLCDVARENHTFWDGDWAREPLGFFISVVLTDAGAAGKLQVSPFRVNLELRDYELLTGSETCQVLERFWWEKASQREIKNCFTCPPLTSCFAI